ncbi:DUF4177 domain-containing protein [Halalkalibacter krulwichiae]|uniref:DUF4177 domain-containing protein n=1 Tax=Halalkalibacter krulwichiae TaxID=199441 RepID=UPI001470B94B|nr:DUF4177 domain-containing protein [Halalkalibacter krulwichiae]
MEYKTVKLNPVESKKSFRDLEFELNDHTKGGWRLHSFIPQINEGNTDVNIAIFERDDS